MRKAAYEVMLRAPFKVGGGALSFIGAVGTLWPDWVQKRVGGEMTADQIELISKILLVGGLIYFALLWLLKPGQVDSPAPSQSTSGTGSPAIGSVAGDVYFNPPPAAVQERKQYQAAQRDWVGPRLPERDISSGIREGLGLSEAKPDLPLNGVLVRIYKLLGPAPTENIPLGKFWRRVDLAIADAVVHEGLHTWGRLGDRALSKLHQWNWEHGTFNHKIATLRVPVDFGSKDYKDLHFSKAEIDRVWPLPPETTNDGRP